MEFAAIRWIGCMGVILVRGVLAILFILNVLLEEMCGTGKNLKEYMKKQKM